MAKDILVKHQYRTIASASVGGKWKVAYSDWRFLALAKLYCWYVNKFGPGADYERASIIHGAKL